MTSWLNRWRGTTGGATQGATHGTPQDTPQDSPIETRPPRRVSTKPDISDPNAPVRRLQLHQKCLYERMLPGRAFISAHVNRLQHGYYESKALHEAAVDNIYFVSVHFVFHPQDHRSHRFKSAVIKVSLHGFDPAKTPSAWYGPPQPSPRILKHAPELIYGAVSPENLQWNFSLSSSLGVSQAPVAATVNPSGGVRSSYKVYDMMTMQGSLRTMQSPFGPEYDVEDAMAVWTLEENQLQRSGLPREFDFVLLAHKPDEVKNMYMTVDVDAVVEGWWGQYPQWYTNLSKYMPTQDYSLDFNTDVGQRFIPTDPGRGFNFANLPHPLEEYVTMPGTTYPTNDALRSDEDNSRRHHHRQFDGSDSRHHDYIGRLPNPSQQQPSQQPQMPQQPLQFQQQEITPTRSTRSSGRHPSNRHSWVPETVNVRVMLEHSSPRSPSLRRYSGSPINNLEPLRHHSIRRRRSRSELKEYGAQQALHDTARAALNGSIENKTLG